MDAPLSEGLVTLNAEGRRYTASFRIERGVIIVTSGSVSARVELGDVISPQSTARTILRSMVREGRAADWVSQPHVEICVTQLRRTPVRHHRAGRSHLGYWQGRRG